MTAALLQHNSVLLWMCLVAGLITIGILMGTYPDHNWHLMGTYPKA